MGEEIGSKLERIVLFRIVDSCCNDCIHTRTASSSIISAEQNRKSKSKNANSPLSFVPDGSRRASPPRATQQTSCR